MTSINTSILPVIKTEWQGQLNALRSANTETQKKVVSLAKKIDETPALTSTLQPQLEKAQLAQWQATHQYNSFVESGTQLLKVATDAETRLKSSNLSLLERSQLESTRDNMINLASEFITFKSQNGVSLQLPTRVNIGSKTYNPDGSVEWNTSSMRGLAGQIWDGIQEVGTGVKEALLKGPLTTEENYAACQSALNFLLPDLAGKILKNPGAGIPDIAYGEVLGNAINGADPAGESCRIVYPKGKSPQELWRLGKVIEGTDPLGGEFLAVLIDPAKFTEAALLDAFSDAQVQGLWSSDQAADVMKALTGNDTPPFQDMPDSLAATSALAPVWANPQWSIQLASVGGGTVSDAGNGLMSASPIYSVADGQLRGIQDPDGSGILLGMYGSEPLFFGPDSHVEINGTEVQVSNANETIHRSWVESVNTQTVQVTETVNHLAKGSDVATSKELVTSGGARIINSTTADGHIREDTWATVNGKQTLQSSKIISYSQAERDTAALDVSLAGLELIQALRSNNKVQAAGSLIRLVNNAEIASNQMPTLGAIGTGFSGAVSLISALDSWGNASDGERIALTARAVLGANEVAKAFSANGQTGFLESSAVLGALQGVVALSNLESTIESKNPFAIASSVMALTNAAVATGMVTSATAAGALGTTAFSSAAVFGPQAMIAVAIASIVFGSLFGGSVEYPSPPPAGTVEIGALADGTLGMLLKDADGKVYQTRKLTGAVVSNTGKDTDTQNWAMGADVLSQRMSALIGDLQAQAAKDGTHLVLDRLPMLTVVAYPSFDRNGVDNFFFAIRFNDPGTGAQQMTAAANQDMAKQFKEMASYAGAVVGATEWAQIQAKKAAGDSFATETEGQYVDRLSGRKEGDSVLTKAQADAQEASNRQTYSLLTLDLEGNGITRKAQQASGMRLEDVQADTTKGVTRLNLGNYSLRQTIPCIRYKWMRLRKSSPTATVGSFYQHSRTNPTILRHPEQQAALTGYRAGLPQSEADIRAFDAAVRQLIAPTVQLLMDGIQGVKANKP